ncbi:hypothetical protein B0J12DRAFT_648564 [Macrophomina phaseolina]|uniref:Uncharacterized protein n=1 Tax=Macrophomina phaseolina TaxID=35725 RepID=A0ABQ8GQ42_9PEZI|nr:hypothetical protein B0J12DRAFT_648564 [Macrophomina phaseolina]
MSLALDEGAARASQRYHRAKMSARSPKSRANAKASSPRPKRTIGRASASPKPPPATHRQQQQRKRSPETASPRCFKFHPTTTSPFKAPQAPPHAPPPRPRASPSAPSTPASVSNCTQGSARPTSSQSRSRPPRTTKLEGSSNLPHPSFSTTISLSQPQHNTPQRSPPSQKSRPSPRPTASRRRVPRASLRPCGAAARPSSHHRRRSSSTRRNIHPSRRPTCHGRGHAAAEPAADRCRRTRWRAVVVSAGA